jgi:hypothetical protein
MTSVEWLAKEYEKWSHEGHFIPKHLLEQAKEMEKQQKEKMYSEEEVRKIAEEVRWHVPATGNPREFTKNFDKWFDQFKKK